MATTAVSPDLVWLLVKKHNAFLVERGGGTTASQGFSSEPNNLYNKNSFKYSGLANKKTVALEAGSEGLEVVLTTTKTRKQGQPKDSKHRQVLKKDFRRKAKTVINQVQENRYRADLAKPALARLYAIEKSLKVAKAGGKKVRTKGAKKALATRQ